MSVTMKVLLVLLLSGVYTSGTPLMSPSLGQRDSNSAVSLKHTRIIGGRDAEEGEFPYQVSVSTVVLGEVLHSCGGVIIDTKHVLTTASCVAALDVSSLYIIAGDLKLSENSGYEQQVEVNEVVVHPDYNDQNYRNDIAVLKLRSNLNFGFGVNSIPLPLVSEPANADCIILGWGLTAEEGETSDTLQMATVNVYSDSKCTTSYPEGYIENDSMICAGDIDSGKDFCQGDEGGPLACNDYLYGLSSFGYGCARGIPSVYTQVFHFKSWISEVLEE